MADLFKKRKALKSGLLQVNNVATSLPHATSGGSSPSQSPQPTTGVKEPRTRDKVGSTAYAGLAVIIQGLYDCSDMFLPLKTAAGGFLAIYHTVEVRIIPVLNTMLEPRPFQFAEGDRKQEGIGRAGN
jgi:hypothetical protein